MKTHSSQYHAYKMASHTVAKTRQIVMLYDGAIRFLQQAKEAIEAKKYEERFHLLTKVSAIMTGLQSSLDFDGQPEMAQSLYDFYGDIELKIAGLQRSNDPASCEALTREIREMRNVWDEIDRSAVSAAAAASPAFPETEVLPAEAPPAEEATPETPAASPSPEPVAPFGGILVSA